MGKKTIVFGCWLLILSCNQQPSPILGNWVAADVVEAGEQMELAPEEVRFEFLPTGEYNYHSTLRYQEAGHYEIQGAFLVATDTTHNEREERIVAIEKLMPDTLILRMKSGEVERRVLFLRP